MKKAVFTIGGIMSFWSFLFSTAAAETFPSASIPEITSEIEFTDWADLVFGVTSYESTKGKEKIVANGVYAGKHVAITFVMDAGWQGDDKSIPGMTLYKSNVTMISNGAESDNFLHALATLYGSKQPIHHMRDKVQFTAISLGGDPRNLRNEAVKIKLFFEPINPLAEEDYAEVFLNLDMPNKKIHFNEKDIGYREAIIRALNSLI